MKHEFTETGYTPENLKTLIKLLLPGVTYPREKFAQMMNVRVDAVDRWCVEPDRSRHSDMPHKRWLEALALLEAEGSNSMNELTTDPRITKMTVPFTRQGLGNLEYLAEKFDIKEGNVIDNALRLYRDFYENTQNGKTFSVTRK